MHGLQFKRLVLVSDTTKSANQFTFPKRLNLITGKNNSIGKSTLVKNLFWALGCEPGFDENWTSNDCKVLLEFSISGKDYIALRVNETIIFGEKNGNYKKFNKITGEFSEVFLSLVNFKAKLPSRGEAQQLQTPPPAYYFLPFYIDQIRSWSAPWDSFKNLGQYSSWKPTIVKYHTGYLSPEHFELEEQVFEYEDIKREVGFEIKKINTALEVVDEYIPKDNIALTEQQFEEITKEIEDELGGLAKSQEVLLEEFANVQSNRFHLEKQLEIAKQAAVAIGKDYEFAVECIDGDELECPLCGVLHDNSLASRSSILADQQQAQEQIESVEYMLSVAVSEFTLIKLELDQVKSKISEINYKYHRPDSETDKNDFRKIIDSFASISVQRNVEQSKFKKEATYKSSCDSQKELKKRQKALLGKEDKDGLGESFSGFLLEIINKLNAQGVNLNKVKHPTDYNKIFGSGGAAEGTRAVLAYQVSVLRQIYQSSSEIPAPLVVDTPNQQEQADQNYKKIIEVIVNDTPSSGQIILCGMEHGSLDKYKLDAHIIELNDSKLLSATHYPNLSDEVHKIFSSAGVGL